MQATQIPLRHDPDDDQIWRRHLAGAIRDPRTLLARLGLTDSPLASALDTAPEFAVRVPEPLLACMEPGNPNDPVLRQVLALDLERRQVAGFTADPLSERSQNPIPGLLHKYHGRALLIVSGGCAVHCRYCFRRHFPYADNNPGLAQLQPALDYLSEQTEIREIILSGGDPLMLDDAALDRLLTRLEAIPHLQRLRLHTRFPVVIPQRLTRALAQRLAASRLRAVMVLHVNHANELQPLLLDALEPLRRNRIALLNQAVLLRGVNDSLPALSALNERCFDQGITPYYLHLLDQVSGAAHFEVPEAEARRLYSALAASQPGYLVPRLVREQPGLPGKQPLPPQW